MSNIIKNTYLCIKYPFLYPKNRWTGKHYTNWTLHNYMYGERETPYSVEPIKEGIYDKAYYNTTTENGKLVHHIKSVPYLIWFKILKVVEFILPIFHCIPKYTEWDHFPYEGWKQAFGNDMLKEVGKWYWSKSKNIRRYFRITDIKEKYGELRFYCNFYDDDLIKIIDKYSEISLNACINCGKEATHMSKGWICPYCDECDKKKN